MFNLSTQEVVLSIEKTPLVKLNNHVFQYYHNFFGNTDDFDLDVNKMSFDRLENQGDDSGTARARRRLSYSETFSKHLQVFFMNSKITNALENKFETDLKFGSVDYWIDGENYFLEPHVDDDSIKLSLQIYFGEGHPGTVLFDNDQAIKTFHFANDCGYAMLLNNKTSHGLEYPVKSAGRRSLYVRYQ